LGGGRRVGGVGWSVVIGGRGRDAAGGEVGVGDFGSAVHGEVGQGVGEGVVAAKVVTDLGSAEGVEEGHGLLPEGFEGFVADFVFAAELLDDEFGVAEDAEVLDAKGLGVAETGEEAGVFGDVVGGAADELTDGPDGGGVVGFEDGADTGRAGVTAGAAVEAEGDSLGDGHGEEKVVHEGHEGTRRKEAFLRCVWRWYAKS
jgi:hypothetical protein